MLFLFKFVQYHVGNPHPNWITGPVSFLHHCPLDSGHIIALIEHNIFACIYFNPDHPLKDESNSTSHMILSLHFLH